MNTDKCRVEFKFHFLEEDSYVIYEHFIIKGGIFRGSDLKMASESVDALRKYMESALYIEVDGLEAEDERSYLYGMHGQRIGRVVVSDNFVSDILKYADFDEMVLNVDFDDSQSYYKLYKLGTNHSVHLSQKLTLGELLNNVDHKIVEYFVKANFVVAKFNEYSFTTASVAYKYFSQEISNIVRTSKKVIDGEVYLVPAIERVRKYLKGQGVYKDMFPYAEPEWKKWTELEVSEIVVRRSLQTPLVPTEVGIEFEKKVAGLLSVLGWNVKLTKATGDFGVDIIAEKRELSVAIQVKSGTTKTGVAAVQQAFTGAKHYGVDYAAVISNAEFTPAAFDLAVKTSVHLFRANQISEFDSILL